MIDIAHIESLGGTAKELKKKFSPKPSDGRVKELVELCRDQMEQGIRRNLEDAKLYWAIDQAFDTPQRQITPTLARGLTSSKLASDQVLKIATDWGFADWITQSYDDNGQPRCTSGGTPVKSLDLPVFFNVFVPAAYAYTKIRWAKLYGDRDLYPLYKYDPLVLSMPNRIKAELITSRINRMSQEMGYREDERQSILQALQYGVCLNFPKEAWYKEEQVWNGKKRTEREGIRFEIPHPSRTFCDLSSRLTTLNSDTGCSHNGFWALRKFRDIKNNKDFWNTDSITAGFATDLFGSQSANWTLYQSLFPCSMSFPSTRGIGGSSGAGEGDREKTAFTYTNESDEQAVIVTSFFTKIIPKEWDLFDYDHPIWMRLLFADHDTVIHAEPIGYTPACAYLYDHDQNRARNTSLVHELMPWQDTISNYLTQYLLSVKQNLESIVFYNKDMLSDGQLKVIKNLGENRYRSRTFLPWSPEEFSWQQQSGPREMFHSVSFAKLDTGEIAGAISTVIGIMERMLGFSSQELGAPASHEQSATETNVLHLNTSVRLAFTASGLDAGAAARKNMLYEGMMNYSDDEVFAEVADLNEVKRKELEKLGFKVESEEDGMRARAGVTGSKKAMALAAFASDRDGANRIQDAKIAATMIQTFQAMFSNPLIVEKAGVTQLIDLFNQILVYTGLPKDFRLKLEANPDADAAQQQAVQQLEQLQQGMQEQVLQIATQVAGQSAEALLKELQESFFMPMAQALKTLSDRQATGEQSDGAQDQALMELAKITRGLMQLVAPGIQPMQPMPPEQMMGVQPNPEAALQPLPL